MVGYADRAALEQTRATGEAHYHSRSRGALARSDGQRQEEEGRPEPDDYDLQEERGSSNNSVEGHAHAEIQDDRRHEDADCLDGSPLA